jgi:hypothetical protein
MKKTHHLLLVLMLYISACTTQRISVLNPNVPAQFVDTEGFVTQKSDSLDVTFGFLFSTKDHLVFEVNVKNKSKDSILVEPMDFSFQPIPSLDSANGSKPFAAQSFRQISRILDERVHQARVKTAVIVLATVVTIVAVDAAAHKLKSKRYRDYSYTYHPGIHFSYNYFDAVLYHQINKREARKGVERHFMFPKKLAPEESYIGTVYFPRFDNASTLLFNFKTDGQDFKTLFSQTIKER